MKIRNYSVGLLLAAGVLFGNNAHGQATVSELFKAKPAAPGKNANILINYKHSFIRSYELTLANGVRVVIRADEGRKDILMTATCHGGASVVGDIDYESAMHAGEIIGNGGLGNFSGAEVNQFFQQKNMSLTPGIDEKYSTLKGSFQRDDLETFLQAITLYFTQPRKDKAYFDSHIKGLEVALAARNKDPYKVFRDTVTVLTTGNKNRVNTLSTTKIKEINLDRAYDIYRQCFGNAHGFTFVFTGNFKADDMNEPSQAVLDLLGQYLGSLPSGPDSVKIADRNTEIPQGKIYKKVYNGHAPLAAVQLVYSGSYQHTDSVNLQLKVLSYLLEKKLDTLKAFGGVNKASVKLVLNRYPKETYAINIAFKCTPVQVDKMLATVHETIAGLQHGIQPEEIKQYVAMRKRELRVQTFDYVFWRDYLTLQFMNADDPYEVVHYPYNFYKTNEKTIQQAANQFLTGNNYIQAVLLPAKK